MATANPSPIHTRREQPLPIRISHWCNALFIVLMAGSGLEIFRAYPALGPRGAQYHWYPLQNMAPPRWLCLGGWLEGGRHWHFAIAWFFAFNGAIYLTYFFVSGEWRRRMFLPWRDLAGAVAQFAYYTRMRRYSVATTARASSISVVSRLSRCFWSRTLFSSLPILAKSSR